MKKKIISALCASIMICMSAPVLAEDMYVMHDDFVYLRTGPASNEYYITAPKGALVDSIGWEHGSDGYDYNEIIYKGVTGWVRTEHLSYSKYGKSSSVRGEIMYVSNVKEAVYLRKAPASDEYYQTVALGEKVDSIGWERGSDGAGYNYVDYNGREGWIKTEYLSDTPPSKTISNQSTSHGDIMYVSNANEGVFLRTAPASDTYYEIIPSGASVISIGWKRGSDGIGYNQVEYNGLTGWVKTKYLSSKK